MNPTFDYGNTPAKGLDEGFITIPATCRACQGKCFVPNNSSATQEQVAKTFGYPIPAECVTLSTGRAMCPYAPCNR